MPLFGALLWAGSASARDEDFPGRNRDPFTRQTLSASTLHSLAADADGTVWAWGENGYGQLGDGTTTSHSTPTRVQGLSGIVSVSAGNSYSLALHEDGTVWGWGDNVLSQLAMGPGGMEQYNSPTRIPGLTDVVSISASVDNFYSLAVRQDGTVWAWGGNIMNPLGDWPTLNPVPFQMPGLSDIVAVSAHTLHQLALRRDGTVWAWGYNWGSQFEDGTVKQLPTPVQVQGLTEVVAIAAGYSHSMALRRDGTVWTWGLNGAGELGDGTAPMGSATPVQVLNLSDVVAISASYQYSLALRRDGTVWAWGDNVSYVPGTEPAEFSSPVPVQRRGLTGIWALSAGPEHAMALRHDGTLWIWGRYIPGQTGPAPTPSPLLLPCRFTGMPSAEHRASTSHECHAAP